MLINIASRSSRRPAISLVLPIRLTLLLGSAIWFYCLILPLDLAVWFGRLILRLDLRILPFYSSMPHPTVRFNLQLDTPPIRPSIAKGFTRSLAEKWHPTCSEIKQPEERSIEISWGGKKHTAHSTPSTAMSNKWDHSLHTARWT